MKKNYFKCVLLSGFFLLGVEANAQFSGDFAPANWTLINTSVSSDATVNTSGAPASITFTGNDSDAGDCCSLYDDYQVNIPANCGGTGTITFDYNFNHADIEEFYYVVNGAATFVTDLAQTGSVTVNVIAGGTFAFRIYSDDDCCGVGVLTVTNFTYTETDLTGPLADLAMLADVTGACSVNAPTAPTATDACAGAVTGTTTTIFPITTVGTTIVTWSYDDGNGNITTQNQNIIVTDVTAPVADVAMLSDVTNGCSVDAPVAPTATDDCSGTITGTTTTVFPITTLGTTVVTWTYDDGNGNIATQDQNIVVTNTLSLSATTTNVNTGNDGAINLTVTGNTGIVIIDWDNDGVGDNDDSEDLTGLTAGSYNVMVTDGGCVDSLTVVIGHVGLSSNDFVRAIYPNPTNGLLNINLNNDDIQSIQVTDNLGRIVYSEIVKSETLMLDLSHFENGIYFVQGMIGAEQVFVVKIAKD